MVSSEYYSERYLLYRKDINLLGKSCGINGFIIDGKLLLVVVWVVNWVRGIFGIILVSLVL